MVAVASIAVDHVLDIASQCSALAPVQQLALYSALLIARLYAKWPLSPLTCDLLLWLRRAHSNSHGIESRP